MSAFNYVFKDLQLQNFNSTTVQFVTFNASELTSRGFDVDFAWRSPVEGLNFSGGFAYTSAKFTDDLFITRNRDTQFAETNVPLTRPGPTPGTTVDVPPPTENLRGRQASRAPKISGNVAFDFAAPVSDGIAIGLNGNMAFAGSYWTANNSNFTIQERPFGDFKQKGYVTFDGSISIGAPDKKWKLALVGVNLTNKSYVLTSGTRPFAAPGPTGVSATRSPSIIPRGDDLIINNNRGRQVFLEASFKF
jgi:iron complex outermembrane recepter protein